MRNIKSLFFNLLLRIIFAFPFLLDSFLIKKLIKIPFILLVGKIDYDAKVNINERYKKPLKRGLERYLDKESTLPDNILDLGTGTGSASIYLAEKFPKSNITGIDISKGMLKKAREKAQEKELKNIRFVEGDIFNLPFANNKFDLISVANAPFSLSEVKRTLKNEGYFLVSLSKGGAFLADKKGRIEKILFKYDFEISAIDSIDEIGLFILLKSK